MTRDEVIEATRKAWRQSPFVWGQADCMMSVFDYARELTGVDGGAEWRGTYADEAGALAVLDAAGGGAAGFAKGMALAGAVPVETPQRGDVLVVRLGEHEIGGLCLGDMAMFRLAGPGVVEVTVRHLEVLGAWRP